MSRLPPPPPNAAPYAPPPPQGGQNYPYPYQGQAPYQPPPPASGYGHQSYQNGYPPSHSSPPRGGPTSAPERGPPKSRMQVTRYPPPPGHNSYQGQQYGGHYQQSPSTAYPPSTWGPPQQPYGPPPTSYAPPPPGPYSNPPNYPPPPAQQPPYGGYGQPPAPYVPPPPPQHGAYSQPYPPPPNNQPPSQGWTTPQPQYPPQPVWSPPPAAQGGPIAPPTPVQSAPSTNPPIPAPIVGPHPVKDRSDPTFYDGWDEAEFEWGQALWPKANETIDDRFSIGQYIWHPAEQLTRAIASNIDVPLPEVATTEEKHGHNNVQLIASKYFQSDENEGDEYIYNFQRIRYIDEWAERKDDPIFQHFSDVQLHNDVLPKEEILDQVLEEAKRLRDSRSQQSDVMGSLEQALSSYIGNVTAASGPGSATGAPEMAAKGSRNDAQEALLASLGVSGDPKPVYTTPFPAYAPVVEDPIFSQPATRRTSSTQPVNHPHPPPHHSNPPPPPSRQSSHPLQHTPQSSYPPPPPQHPSTHPPPPPAHLAHHPPPPPPAVPPRQSPLRDQRRSASADPWNDPWRANQFGGSKDSPPVANGPGTPVGSDFGDLHPNGSGSDKTLKGDEGSPPPRQDSEQNDSKKRKNEDPDGIQRKRSKAKIHVDAAYQRRW